MPSLLEYLREKNIRSPGPQVLDQGNGQLTGSIPAEIGSLRNLQVLYLQSNQLTGNIPPEIGSLSNLQYLWLHSNQLTESIPVEISSLRNLQYLYLQYNQLTGSIPVEMALLINLRRLCLQHNQFTGRIDPKLFSLTARYVNISHNYLTSSASVPDYWEQEYAFRSPPLELMGEIEGQLPPSSTHSNPLPGEMIKQLKLQCIREEHTALLTDLVNSQQLPSSLEEWVALGFDIGFPDNGVWSAVAHVLEDIPAKVEQAMQRRAAARQQIEELRSKLKQLEEEEAQWTEWETSIKQLHTHTGAMADMAKQLSQIEQGLSLQAMQQFAEFALPASDDEDDSSPVTTHMSPSAWQVILRSAGLSARSTQLLKNKMEDVLSLEADLSTLSLTERCDVRYLSQMVECKSVPFVHPFGERYAVNQQLQEEDASPGPYESSHSCVVCDCDTPYQVANLVKERASPLAKLDWAAHSINGPRMMVMTSQELQELFQVDKADIAALQKAQRTLKNKHLASALQDS